MPSIKNPLPARAIFFLLLFASLCQATLPTPAAGSKLRASYEAVTVERLKPGAPPEDYSEYAGRYTDGIDYVIYFKQSPYGLTLRPALWTATQLLRPEGKDQFVVVDRAERGATFQRDEQGRVVAVTIRGMEGEGKRLSRAGLGQLAVELLLSGQGRAAALALLNRDKPSADRFTQLAERVLSRFPSKSLAVASFLLEAANRFPRNPSFHALMGYAYVQAGNRRSALSSLQKAYSIDPTNKDVISGLARLNALPPSARVEGSGWKLPFPLASVFDRPSAAEIKEVEADWRSRDLRPAGISEVARGKIGFGQYGEMSVRIVSHLVKGQRHYGAIIAPPDARPGCCPVIVEAKGVSWNYFPLELEKLHSTRMMGDQVQQFIYVVPSFRGEVLKFDGATYQSEGDRTDAWDGATDDAIALLSVALQTTPAADASRICAFGQSRGGTIALLMGERDPRVRCVASWAGPTDWFELMGTEGWTQQELFAEGMRTRARPDETGGQLIEHFLLKAMREGESLSDARHRMIAASPLYFALKLPRTQVHYGIEDPYVPVRNGRQLISELRRLKVPATRYSAFFYPGEGHDTDRIAAPVTTREFLTKILLRKKSVD